MAENSPPVLQHHEEEPDAPDEDDTTNSTINDSSSDEKVCIKTQLPQNIAAYIENRELIRECETLTCDKSLIEKVMTNYIIAKKILSNLRWQDKMLCKQVCSTWHSAVHALQKEQVSPADFILDVRRSAYMAQFEKSNEFYSEPLVVLSFANLRGFNMSYLCEQFNPCACEQLCEGEHYLIDVLQQLITVPKDCMLTAISVYLAYMPLPDSPTAGETITRHRMFTARPHPMIMGLYIPVIPDVKFNVLNIRNVSRSNDDMQKNFFDEIDKISSTRIIKGLIVYVTEKFLLHSVEDIIFLDYLKRVQPDVPYALAGCMVEETMYEQSNINVMIDRSKDGYNFVSENFVSIGVFSVPKTASQVEHNFDMYSLVIDSSEWSKAKIQQAINEFGREVPHFEHSVALKLSCVGRDQKHEIEQDCFRAVFPNTPIAGCYGNGELGVNHPAREPVPAHPRSAKRVRQAQQGLMYSYSTVFMYIGWGKITEEPKK